MFPNPFDSGKLAKMIIQAMKPVKADEKPEVSDKDEDKYMVQVNPENYKVNYQINYDRKPAHGNSGTEATYANTSPPVLDFEFLFDGTGVIPPPAGPLDNVPIAGAIVGAISDLISGSDEYDVTTELQKFAKVVYDYSGNEHKPRKIRLTWGKLIFDGVLTSLTIDYKIFRPNGDPLRAIAHASFDGSISDMLRENKEKNNSPDLTHLRSVIAGDKLPLLANTIYRNANLYLEVARTNKMFNFRNLHAGDKVVFPPVDKATR